MLEHKAEQIEDKFNEMLLNYNKKINSIKDEVFYYFFFCNYFCLKKLNNISKIIELENINYE